MIHQYKLNGYNIVLDVYSGSVHAVDDLAYDVIAMYKNATKEQIIDEMLSKYADNPEITKEEISDCIDDVKELEEQGKLFTDDKYENLAFDFKKRNTVIKALCLHIAHTCNLNCEYCFASQGKYHGERALMSFEVGKRAIDFLIENSGSRVNKHTVCCKCKTEVFVVFLFNASCIGNNLLYNIKVHKRFSAEEVNLKVYSAA